MKKHRVRITLDVETDASIHVLRETSFWQCSIRTAWRIATATYSETLRNIHILQVQAAIIKENNS